jgi:FtsP/CotA-like multicopper oxidase with cupredoxin domain
VFRPTIILGLVSFLCTNRIVVQATYPGTPLVWKECGENTSTLCGVLEFCQDGNSYGYRTQGDTAPCGTVNGPLIRMEPGKTYKLTLQNEASEMTNIHTHGLHIVGDGDGNDVTRMVSGGSSSYLTYTWDIACGHPPGTYWYHPHFHGLTNEQTAGGAFGMLIIEDDPSTLEDSGATWAALPDQGVLLQISDAGGLLGNGKPGDEALEMDGGRWYRLRVSVVDPSAKPSELEFVYGDGSCSVCKVASDGV